jgi:hypothetical protein
MASRKSSSLPIFFLAYDLELSCQEIDPISIIFVLFDIANLGHQMVSIMEKN